MTQDVASATERPMTDTKEPQSIEAPQALSRPGQEAELRARVVNIDSRFRRGNGIDLKVMAEVLPNHEFRYYIDACRQLRRFRTK